MSIFNNKLFHLHQFRKLEPQRGGKFVNKLSSKFNNKSFIASFISIVAAVVVAFLPTECFGIDGLTVPISTSPNAIAHSTGLVKQNEMLKVGIVIGIIGMVLGYFTLRLM